MAWYLYLFNLECQYILKYIWQTFENVVAYSFDNWHHVQSILPYSHDKYKVFSYN